MSTGVGGDSTSDCSDGATNCREVLEQVYLYLDGEMGPLDHDTVRHHLDDCSPCLREFGVEQVVKTLVSRCCGGDVPSPEMRVALLERLRTAAMEAEAVEYRAD